MKIVKMIVYVVVPIVILIFGYSVFYRDTSSELKKLKDEYSKLDSAKKQADVEIFKWKNKSDSLLKIDNELSTKVTALEVKANRAEEESNKSKENLNKIKINLSKSRDNIKKLEETPFNRTGDDLITSLKNKTNSNNDFPKFETDDSGQVFVTLTIEQAQKLDNNTDLLSLFRELDSQIGKYDSASIKVINDKEEVIAIQKVQISTLKEQILIKDDVINSLQNQINAYISKVDIMDKQIANRENVIKEKDKQIKKLKFKNILTGITTFAATILLVLSATK